MNSKPPKKATSFRLSPEALRLLKLLAAAEGINQTSILEIAVRDLAKLKGIK